MKQTIYSLFLLAIFGITGMNAWADDLTTTEIDGITYYEINDAAGLVAFADLVNGDAENEIPGQPNANAILTADIDMTGIAWEAPIGVITGDDNGDVGPGAFTGIFDGQGHQITGFATTSTGHGGLIGDANGATIKNFSISGILTVTGGHGAGVVAYSASSTIYNVHSALEIDVAAETGSCHVGGVVGSSRGGNTITGCTFNGTLTVAVGNHDCFGGIVGYGGDNISFCANYGTITFGERGCYAGGITGYLNNDGTYIRNCLNIGSLVYDYPEGAEEAEQTPKYASAIVGRLRSHDQAKMTGNCWLEGSARGAGINDSGADDLTLAFCFPPDLLPTGEVCYKLNGDQTIIGWYQTLGTDQQPVLDNTHAQVYMNGRKHCNGDLYEGYTFTNEPTEIIQDEHDMVNGICSYCGFYDEDVIAASMVQNADGYYEISNPAQLKWFSKFVNANANNFGANAILTADIDLSKVISVNKPWTAIGDWGGVSGTSNACYKGHFDGQGHTITGFNATSTHNYYGIFGVVSSGALIENFTIYGEMALGHKTGGVVGYSRDATPTIRNIHSHLKIHCTEAATTALRPGGILGTAVNGTTIVENCIYSDTIFVGGHTGNIGGIVGYINNNSAAIVNITNCLFDGEIQNGTSADGQCGGIVGYNNGGKATIKNCLSIGIIVSSDGNIGQLIGRLNGSNTTFANNYYLGDFVNGTSSGKSAKGSAPVQVDTDQLESGEVCWELNEEKFLDSSWRQTLSEDETGDPYPLPTGEGDYVYEFSTGLDNITNDNIDEIIRDLITEENEFLDQIEYVYRPLIEAYQAQIESWENIEDVEEFFASYRATLKLKEDIEKSAAAYDKYIEFCEQTIIDAEELDDNKWTTLLNNYLEQDLEPNNDYPNGSYNYILENCNLDDEALAEEIAFVNQMLQNAIAGGITAGTEITRLLTNSNFAEGFEGWTTESEGITLAHGGVTDIMHIVRGLGNGTFNASQTVGELPNGIYIMTTNAMFRASSNDDSYSSKFYAGKVFMNGTENYVMTAGEDVLKSNEGMSGMTEYAGEDAEGYVPSNMNGCSYAFSADHYLNYCATEVTDSTLTVGFRSLGTGLDGDWMPFGNMHIYYLGTAEEAEYDEKVDSTLAGFAKRAMTIRNFSKGDDVDEMYLYPNISTVLKGTLDFAIAQADSLLKGETLENGETKLELINRFSELFNEVYSCRKAYIEMVKAANKLYDYIGELDAAGLISEEEYNEWDDECTAVQQTHYPEGDLTTEEAWALVEKLNGCKFYLNPVDGIYQIADATELRLFAMIVNGGNANAKAVLMNDIDMSEVNFEDYSFTPIGSASTPFQGEFDGQGYKITNFGQCIKEDEEDPGYYTLVFSGNGQGLFGCVSEATIKNFSIDGAFEMTGGKYTGAIGQVLKSTISNVHSALNIAVTANGCHHTGGVVGSTEGGSSSTITNCSFSGTMTVAVGSTDNFAGIVGYITSGDKVTNCANYGNVTFYDAGCAVGGIVGYLNSTTTIIQNCLNTGSIQLGTDGIPTYGSAILGRTKGYSKDLVKNNYWLEGSAYAEIIENGGAAVAATGCASAEQLASGEVCYKLNGDQSEINWFQTLGADEFPVLYDTHKVVYKDADGTYTNEKSNTGTGTQDDPFIIKSAADLSNLINLLVSGRMNYVVMEDDVDMAGVTGWTPLFNIADQSNGYPFIDFDGKGHVISNLTSNAEGDYAYNGLFGILCGSVRNLGVKDADVTCAGGTGILAGYLGHSTFGQPCYVENVWVTGKVTANGYCGGMFGNVACESHFLNCYANVEVNGAGDLTGGIIGRVRAKIDMNQVYAAGSINRGGGIIGGGFQDATPAGTYNRVAVWNNTNNNFGPVRDSDELSGIIYYDGTNFADLQTKVVEWDSNVWSCDMQPGSYPVLAAFDPDGIKGVVADKSGQAISIYNLAGQRLEKLQKGINIVNGKKVLVK